MSIAGYAPQLKYCSLCKGSVGVEKIGFSFEQRGIICAPCSFKVQPQIRFQAGILKYLIKLSTMEIKHADRLKFPKGTETEIEQLTHKYILSYTGRELKSYPFIKNMAQNDWSVKS